VAASWALPPVIWTEIRPLVFINACQSLEISPGTLASYVDAFVGAANSVGVMGTEVKVPQNLAMEFAEVFFRSLVAERLPLERALKAARFAFLGAGNLFGLAYSASAWAHLRVVLAHPPGS
jgi:hypothetical protein